MTITEKAQARLREWLRRGGREAVGFRFLGWVGTCRGSTPQLKLAAAPEAGEILIEAAGIRFFAPTEYIPVLSRATLDYEASFLGRGLVLIWPHQKGCVCSRSGGSGPRPSPPEEGA